MPDAAAKLRPWSSLGEVERTELMLAYPPVLDTEALTCSFERKLERMQAFLTTRGVSITEAKNSVAAPGAFRRMTATLLVLFVASIWAGAQNALAGGGSFITLPSLMLTGMDARAANITSTVALFPAQLVTGYTGRSDAQSPPACRSRRYSPSASPAAARRAHSPLDAAERVREARPLAGAVRDRPVRLGQLLPQAAEAGRNAPAARRRCGGQFFIAIYGGYFGGGIGLLMMASLTMAGLAVRNAGAAKNILAGVMNASAVAIFAFSHDVHWLQALVTATGASFGGWAGALMLKSVNEMLLKIGVIAIGVALTIGLFWKA